MEKNIYYASYKDYMVRYDEKTFTMTIFHEPTKSSVCIVFDGLYNKGEKVFGMEEYDSTQIQIDNARTHHELSVTFMTEKHMPNGELHVYVEPTGITLAVYEIDSYTIRAKGYIVHGDVADCIAVNTREMSTEVIRAAIGPTVSARDNGIYNKLTDSAFVIEGCQDMAFEYDWEAKKYGVTLQTITEGRAEKIKFSVKKDLLKDKYHIEFVPRKKRKHYTTPPTGWMSWYATKFDTCEEAVLRNVYFQEKNLKSFGADTIWVDYEWCHKEDWNERHDGVNNFNPDPVKYPNGLDSVAAKIKEAGFVPALWIGFTNDLGFTDYEKEHPEISLVHHSTWCGLYYYDISHPEYLNGFLPKAIQQVKDWGYEVIKYDTLPECIEMHEKYHSNMHQPEMTTYRAFRGMVERTRELFGEDFYMLSCYGVEEVVLWGAGVFDAARVGCDIFEWKAFLDNLDKVRRYYPLHNIVMYNDPDNVVLREEFSTYEQALSRVAVVSLLGLPLTFGDDLPKLPENRVELLKRALPTMDVHPTDFNNAVNDGQVQMISLNIALPFEQYQVAGIMNLTDESKEREVSLYQSLCLPEGEYLVYDYFKKAFLGIYTESVKVTLDPYDTCVLSLRKKTGRPQIVSTSRHITQGAAEIKEMCWDDSSNTLTVRSSLVKDDSYTVSIYMPEGYRLKNCNQGECMLNDNLLTVTILPKDNCDYKITLTFEEFTCNK